LSDLPSLKPASVSRTNAVIRSSRNMRVPSIVCRGFLAASASLTIHANWLQRTLKEPCPDETLSRGFYRNRSYGFAITIPKSLTGLWNSARCSSVGGNCVCMSDHGRIVPLTPEPYEPERHVEVYAGYAMDPDDSTALSNAQARVAGLRQKGRKHSVSVRGPFKIALDGVDARRARVRYYDENLRRWTIEEFVEAVKDGVEYSLYLRTSDVGYRRNRIFFYQVLNSFRWDTGSTP
jgi:hypothetical protein